MTGMGWDGRATLMCHAHHAPGPPTADALVSAQAGRHGSHAEELDDGEPRDRAEQQQKVMRNLHRGKGGQHRMTASACTDLVSCPFILVLLLLQAQQAAVRCGRPVLTRESRHPGMRMASTDTKQVMQGSARQPGGNAGMCKVEHDLGKAACAVYCRHRSVCMQMPDSSNTKTRTIMLVTGRVACQHVQRPNSLLLRGQGSAGLQGAHAVQAGAGRQLPCQTLIQEWPARLTSFCWSSCPSSSWSGWSRSSSSSSSSSCIARGEQHIWRCASYAVDVALVQGRLNSSSGR